MNELREEIASLEAQEEIIQGKLSEELDDNRAQELMNDLNIVRNKKSEKTFELQQAIEREQQREEAIDEKVHADEIPFAIAGVDLNGIPVELIQLIEEVVKTDRKRIYNEHAIELEQAEQETQLWKNNFDDRGNVLAAFERQYDELNERANNAEFALMEEKELRIDAETKRDAAVREKEESEESLRHLLRMADNDINNLREKLAELERNAEYAERQEQPLTVSPEESTSLQEKADAVKKLFIGTDDWGSIVKVFKPDGGFELVKRADLADWEEATDVPSNEPTIEPPTQFQSEVPDEDAGHEMARDTATTESVSNYDGGEVTRSEFEKRVGQLEVYVRQLNERAGMLPNPNAA